jgi:protein gp37
MDIHHKFEANIKFVDIRDQCVKAKVPFFFKQWGGVQKKKAGRTLEGCTWDEMPVMARA